MPDIEKIIKAAKLRLAKILDEDLRNAQAEIFPHLNFTQSAWASQVLGIKKLQFKEKMEDALDELKIELVRSIVEGEAQVKNRYEVVFLKLKPELIPIKPEQVLEGPQYGQTREVIDLQDGDIPISYQTYLSMFCTGSSSGTAPTGGQQLVHEVVVLRPVVEVQQ